MTTEHMIDHGSRVSTLSGAEPQRTFIVRDPDGNMILFAGRADS